ncbi:GNAT family N-acetyltransferase [Bacillus sp. FJAT-50079]|uniref:GNAT family N-acetyltransferase n=1 Tax=Bacillus sp. FJAT-50079 TaxID=2833577 RepID=UPI001BC9BD96|nr:GNAT family N-acetyltransferase [Bacillus sp. FJAT-50079]MBS4207935.1 GNAT family N-acetyltransferase [Bacillus sp. FJAT-50079]
MEVKKVTTKEELQDAFKIRMIVFVEEQKVPADIEIDEHEDEAVHFVLYDGAQPAGTGRFRVLDEQGKVERICVLPQYRRSGAGLKIMNAIEDYAKGLAIDTLKLNAQTSAIPFYEKLGYETKSDVFMDAGIPHKSMIKKLELHIKS